MSKYRCSEPTYLIPPSTSILLSFGRFFETSSGVNVLGSSALSFCSRGIIHCSGSHFLSFVHISFTSIGLDRKSSIPISKNAFLASTTALAVSATIGTCLPVFFSIFLISCVVSIPSISGIM